MSVTESHLPIAGTGELLDTVEVTTGEGSVHRQAVIVASPSDPDARAEVDKINSGAQVSIVGLGGAAADMFGRLRVSNPVTVFDYQAHYDLTTNAKLNVWEHSVVGTGSATHVPNEACVRLSTGGTLANASITRQQHLRNRYQPGKAFLVLLTAILGAGLANVRRRIGMFDERNGLFFELDGTTLYAVRRSYVSGAAVDVREPRSAWNIDKLDGTGPSGVTLDLSAAHIFVVGGQWLGAGAVLFAFDIGGKIIPCHLMEHANVLLTVYMTTANLPIRYEITNTDAAGSTQTMDVICASVLSEGGVEKERGYPNSVHSLTGSGTALTGSTAVRPLLAIRPAQFFPTAGAIRNEGVIAPRSGAVMATADGIVEVQYNPTLGGGSWIDVDASNSIAQYNNTATTITTGGLVLASRPISGSNAIDDVSDVIAEAQIALGRNIDNSSGDVFCICYRTLTGAATVYGALNWQEYR